MKVTYLGPQQARVVASTGQQCNRGESIDVPDSVGERLVRGSAWERAAVAPQTDPDPDPNPVVEPADDEESD